MKSQRLFEKFNDYQKALARLREAIEAPESDLKSDAVIQRFEFTYEMAWKTVKLYLEKKGIEVNSPGSVFSESNRLGLIKDGNGWTYLQKCRNMTSHTYDEILALQVYRFIQKKALYLMESLAQELVDRLKGGE